MVSIMETHYNDLFIRGPSNAPRLIGAKRNIYENHSFKNFE